MVQISTFIDDEGNDYDVVYNEGEVGSYGQLLLNFDLEHYNEQ